MEYYEETKHTNRRKILLKAGYHVFTYKLNKRLFAIININSSVPPFQEIV